MFDFFSLMVAMVALIVARKTFNQIAVVAGTARYVGSGAWSRRELPLPRPRSPCNSEPTDHRDPVAGNRGGATAAAANRTDRAHRG